MTFEYFSICFSELGAKVHLLTKSRLAQKFPWLNLEGIEAGSYGECTKINYVESDCFMDLPDRGNLCIRREGVTQDLSPKGPMRVQVHHVWASSPPSHEKVCQEPVDGYLLFSVLSLFSKERPSPMYMAYPYI